MRAIPENQPFSWLDFVQHGDGQVNSRVVWSEGGSYATLYAADAGESISRETALQRLLLHVFIGELDVTTDAGTAALHSGEALMLAAGTAYQLQCTARCTFILVALPPS